MVLILHGIAHITFPFILQPHFQGQVGVQANGYICTKYGSDYRL